jgi:hydrogenase-4 component E
MLMIITRRKAVAQVIGFMSVENGLFFAAVVSTYGMPMVVELGVAFDVLVAAILFGIFFLHIRAGIGSLDVDYLNKLTEVDSAYDAEVEE